MLDEKQIMNYTAILKDELKPAMGCTEPIAVAYAAAKAFSLIPGGEKAVHCSILCSGNIIKNVKGVKVPHSGGQKGIETAAALGITGGDASKELEVIANATDEDRENCRELVESGFCDVSLKENVPNLYIDATVKSNHHEAQVILSENHTNITLMRLDDEVLLDRQSGIDNTGEILKGDRTLMTLKGVLEYADQVDLDLVRETLEQQIAMNSAISQEGLDNPWGAQVGKTILEAWGSDVRSCACAKAASGSDARMSGCPMPVVINSGSGNQGITVTMPVLVYADSWKISHDKTLRALIVSNLVSIYIKHYIGALSAFCGAVSASCGVGAAITWMSCGEYKRVSQTITNTLGNVGGIVCDGAKPSCAAKIASSVHAAILAHYMSMSNKAFNAGEGIVEDDVEETIKNMGYIGKIGMRPTDKEILNVMIDKVDVDKSL